MEDREIESLKSLLKRSDLTSEERRTLQTLLQKPSEDFTDLKLNLSAFKRSSPDSRSLRLCLDFGTAMSKAWATGHGPTETLPLLLGKAAGSEGLTVPSTIYIGANGRIYLGSDAERQHRAETGFTRPRFDNLKRMLSEAEVDTELCALPLRDGIDPSSSGLTGGDLLVLYFSWLTDLTEIALETALAATRGKLSTGEHSVRSVVRRFAIPCFESTNGKEGEARAKWARNVMTDALLRAQILADTLTGEWQKLTTGKLRALILKLYELDISGLHHLMIENPAVREPIAAGASRFDAMLGERSQTNRRPSEFLLVVDAGAGTTDFALFQAIIRPGDSKPSYALLRKSVRMSRIAGNEIDLILRAIVLEACGVDDQRLGQEDCAYAKMDLASQIREIKRTLFEKQSITVDLRPAFSGTVTLDRLLSDPRMVQHGAELAQIRNNILNNVFEEDQLDALGAFGSIPVNVLLTGGSGGIPIIRDLAKGDLKLGEARLRFVLVDQLPEWIGLLPREAAQQLANVYPQCAVAIGGSVPMLPMELRTMELPVTPARRGIRKLQRYQVTGT